MSYSVEQKGGVTQLGKGNPNSQWQSTEQWIFLSLVEGRVINCFGLFFWKGGPSELAANEVDGSSVN